MVLDEPMASLDPDTESRVRSAVDKLLHGRTALIIAHRLGTVANADAILVLHRGELVQRGSHRQLLEQDGLYRQLVAASQPVRG